MTRTTETVKTRGRGVGETRELTSVNQYVIRGAEEVSPKVTTLRRSKERNVEGKENLKMSCYRSKRRRKGREAPWCEEECQLVSQFLESNLE